MPRLIYGTAWKERRTTELVVRAVRAGFAGIDTACQPKHYNEAGVGAALSELALQGVERKSLFLQTKFTPLSGHDPKRIPYDRTSPLEQQVAQSFAASQRNLGTEYVDSLVLHSPLSDFADLLTVWRAMEAIAQSGGARQLGISNCYDTRLLQRLHAAAAVKPAVVQNRFYSDSGFDRELRAFCREQGIVYQSFWSLTANPHILRHPSVLAMSQELRRTPAQVWFRFLTQIGIVPLTGTSSQEHMDQDLAIFEFELSQLQLDQISNLLVLKR